MISETAEQQKVIGAWLCDYAEHQQQFDEIKHRHTLKEVGDVAEVGMIRRLIGARGNQSVMIISLL